MLPDDVKEIVEEVKDIAEDGKYLFDRIIIATNKPVSDSAIRGVKTRVIRMPKESYKKYQMIYGIAKRLIQEEKYVEIYREKEPGTFEHLTES